MHTTVYCHRIPNEGTAYEVDAALDFIDSMWMRCEITSSCNSEIKIYNFRSNYSEGSQNGNVEMRRETAQFILENNFVAEKLVLKKRSSF